MQESHSLLLLHADRLEESTGGGGHCIFSFSSLPCQTISPALPQSCKYFGKALSTCDFLGWPLENSVGVIILLLSDGSAVDLKYDFVHGKMITIHSQS